jgi:adenylate kinase
MTQEPAKPAPEAAPAAPAAARMSDLEIKDAQIIFGAVWQGLEASKGLENLRFPK